MVTKTCIAVVCLALVVFLASCGGGGSSQTLLGSTQPTGGGQPTNPAVGGGQNPPQIQPADWEMPELPGTIPDAPRDLASVIAQARLNADKTTSALLTTITSGSASTTSPIGGGVSHDYVIADGGVWAEGQDTSVETEYHVYGTVSNLNLQPNGMSFATIGLVDYFTYDFALFGSPGAPNSQYMFNQNVYLMIRRDGAGDYWVRLADYNSRWGSHEVMVTMPFNFDVMVEPTNPIISTPGVPPYTTHDVGLATLLINNAVIGSSIIYGDNSWGWYRAADAERFDMASGGAMLIGQVYASGDSVTSSMDLTANFESGPVAGSGHPNTWYARGHDVYRRGESPVNGPQNGAILWQTPALGTPYGSGPVLDATGNIFIGNSDANVYAFDNAGNPLAGFWPVNLGGQIWSAGTFSSSGTLFIGVRGIPGGAIGETVALAPDGSIQWVFANPPGDSNMSSILEHQGRVYYGSAQDMSIYVLDSITGAQINSYPVFPGFTECVPALSADGTAVYFNTGSLFETLVCLDLDGNFQWSFGTIAQGLWNPPAVAPDGNIFMGSNAGAGGIYSITPAGAQNIAFGGGSVSGAGTFSSISIDDLGGGQYRVYSRVPGPPGMFYCYDEAGILQWANATLNIISEYGAAVIGADGKIYFPNGIDVVCLSPVDGSVVWSLPMPASVAIQHMALGNNGVLYVGTADGRLIAIGEDPSPITIDCTSLAGASFYLHRPDTTVISGPHDTDVVYNAGVDLSTGDQFYLSFAVDGAASPNDLLIYPTVPNTGLMTVNAASLTIDPLIALYYTNPGGTRQLTLNAGTYNRITNDMTSLGYALYNLRDAVTLGFFGGPYDTNSSGTDQVVLRDGITYRPLFSADAYPAAGSNLAFNGSSETIYPTEWVTGELAVDGDIPGGGVAATVNEQGTVLGDYFTQVGLANTMDSDAYCRFETDVTGAPVNYGYWDVTGATWIVPIFPGLDDAADPFNTAAFARGTSFQVRNVSPGGATADISVDPGQLLDGATSITRSMGFSGNVTLNVIPVRVWDDPALPDPSASITWTGAGWDVGVDFLLQYGQGPYTVELDADYGAAWNDGAANRVYTLAGSQFAAPGLFSDSVSIALASHPAGSYNYAIRVTDTNADEYTYIWPDTLALNLPSGWNVAVPSPDTTDDTGLHTSMTFISGNPAIAYYNFTNGDLMYVRSTDSLGGGWGTPVVVASTDDVGRYCSLVDVVGNPGISFYDITNGRLLYVRSADALGADWTGAGSISRVIDQDPPPPFNGNGVGQFNSMAMVNGRPAVSYYDASYGGLRYGRAATATGSSWGAAGYINVMVHNPGSGSAGWDTSLAVINGNPAISYHRRTGGASGQLWYARADDADGATWAGGSSIRMMVDNGGPTPGGPVGEYTSLADVNGRPAISYYIAKTYGDVRYVRAGDATGSSWTTYRTVHAGAGTDNIGLHTSLAVISGLPAVSYYHATNGDLMYCSATNADGSTWGTNEVADSTGATGGYTSLLEIGGEPAISYYDFTNGDLEYVLHWP